jgi:predicted dehydrogenase
LNGIGRWRNSERVRADPESAKGASAEVVRVGLIGHGYWGPNLMRNFARIRECRLVAVADPDEERMESVRRLYPSVRTAARGEDLFECDDIDAFAIATPISTHYALAKGALCRGKHVLVEKPMTATVSQSEELIRLAEEQKRVLMVDHTFVYSGGVRKVRELIQTGELGTIYYYDAVRINLGLFQRDLNVLWDLAPHDFSIMSYLLDKEPVSVSAVGSAPIRSDGWGPESIAYVTVEYADGTLAHLHLNWLSAVKIRRVLIGGSRRMAVYDHLDPENQLKIFDKGVEVGRDEDRRRIRLQYRTGDMYAPKVDQTEPLELACRDFVRCVRAGRRPLADGGAGLRVVRLLEAAQRSLDDKAAARREMSGISAQ